MDKHTVKLQDSIADTLLITLYAKSVESQKKAPLIHDPMAHEIIRKIDYDFSGYKNKTATSVDVAIRATHFDTMVIQFIQQHQYPVIVLVGCGLDTRLHRIGEIAQKAEFYQLDIAEVIQVCHTLIPPQANEHLIASSMLETPWMDDLRQRYADGKFMFVIEGVLMYFDREQNQQFFTALAERFSGAELHFDMLNQWMSQNTAIHDTVSQTRATFKFGTDDEKQIEQWHPRLKHVRTYLFREFKGWHRMGLLVSTLMSIFPKLKNSTRFLVYQIN